MGDQIKLEVNWKVLYFTILTGVLIYSLSQLRASRPDYLVLAGAPAVLIIIGREVQLKGFVIWGLVFYALSAATTLVFNYMVWHLGWIVYAAAGILLIVDAACLLLLSTLRHNSEWLGRRRRQEPHPFVEFPHAD